MRGRLARTGVTAALLLGLHLGALSVGTRAGESGTAGRWRVLGPEGTPLARVELLTGSAAGEATLAVFDEAAATRTVPTPGGWLELPREKGKAWIVTGEGLGAVPLGSEESIGGLRLLRAAPLTGELRFQGKRPASALPVLARPVGRTGLSHRTRTDEAGRFRFSHLTAGPWELAVMRGDGRRQTIGVFRAGSTPTTSTGAAPFALRSGSLVRGQVRDADANDRSGVEGLAVRLVARPRTGADEESGIAVITTEEGAFVLADVPGGVYEAALVGTSAEAYDFDPEPPCLEVPVQGSVTERAWYVRRTRVVNGRVEAGGGPIQGAEVGLLPDSLARPSRRPRREVAPVETEADGSFRLEGVSIGRGYRLLVRAPGYAPYVGEPFDVTEPEPKSLDPVYLVSGWTLEVHARAPGGAPIPDAEVRVLPASRPSDAAGEATESARRVVRTNADGRAFVTDLPADDVRVEVHATGHLRDEGTAEEPRTGNSRLYTATLFTAPALVGRVVFAATDPPEPVRIHAVPRDGSPPRSTQPDAEGRFLLQDLPAVPTDVEVRRRDGLVLGRIDGVVPGATEDLAIELPPLIGIAGDVVDLDPAAGPAEVLLEAPSFVPDEGEHRWAVIASVPIVDLAARAPFAFTRLAPGMYSVRARQGSNDSDATTVFAETNVRDVVLAMPERGRVAGTVFDEEGRYVLGIEIRLVRVRGEGEAPHLPGGPLRTATDRKGAYVFPDVAPGVWRLETRDETLAGETALLRITPGESLVVDDLVLRPGGVLAGTLTDGGGRTLDGARLELEPVTEGAGKRVAYTGREGRFRVTGLAEGFWRIRVHAAAGAHRDLEALVEVVTHETTEVELTSGGSGRIEGTVEREGKPVADAAVYLLRRTPSTGEIARRLVAHTDGAGTFAWTRLAAGLYEVDLVDGGVRAMRPIAVYDGDVARVELEAWGGAFPARFGCRPGTPWPARP